MKRGDSVRTLRLTAKGWAAAQLPFFYTTCRACEQPVGVGGTGMFNRSNGRRHECREAMAA